MTEQLIALVLAILGLAIPAAILAYAINRRSRKKSRSTNNGC